MKNRKGFTLVEVLVTITIIGIIAVIALPGIQQLQARGKIKKFAAYSEELEYASKLYMDSYAEDIMGLTGDACVDIPYDDLLAKSLIKPYENDGASCSSPNTFVQVRRTGNIYTYDVSLECTKNGKKLYNNILPQKCGGEVLTNLPTIKIEYTNTSSSINNWSSSKQITISVTAEKGLVQGSMISYGWTTDPSKPSADLTTYDFKNNEGEKSATYTFNVNNLNGQYYLYVSGNRVVDVAGASADDTWSNGVLKFDTEPPATPVLNNPRDNQWAGAAFVNANSYKINAKSEDAVSGIAHYQYRYPNSNSNWTTYENSATNNFTTSPFTAQRNEIVEIRACDYAENCSAPSSSTIKIDKTNPTCTISKNIANPNGENGWYKSAVTLSLTTGDTGGSLVNSYDLTTRATPSYNGANNKSQGDTTGASYYGYVKDNAGNVGKCTTRSIKVDTQKPTCAISLSGTKGSQAGVYTSKVTVSIYRNDTGGSGMSRYGMATSQTVSYNSKASAVQDATNGITWYGFVKDSAGNTNTCNSGNFKVTLKPPVISFSLSGSTSIATCTDGNTGAGIWTKTKNLGPSDLTHSVTCTNASGQSTTASHTYKVSSEWVCTSSGTVCDTCHGSNCGGCCGTGGHYCAYPCNCHDECSGGYNNYTYRY